VTFEKYSHIIHNLLEHHWAITETQVDYELFSNEKAKIEGRLSLYDGSFLDVDEKLLIVQKNVVKSRYSYQYFKESQIFRYDNYPNHPGISSPFHHKHTTKGVIQLEVAPKLADIIEEAVRYISSELP
jgi:hypothetical protein